MNLAGQLHHHVFQVIASVAEQEDIQTFVIGGFVRDLLLPGSEKMPKDMESTLFYADSMRLQIKTMPQDLLYLYLERKKIYY